MTDESTEPNDTRDSAAKIEGTQSGYLSYFGDDPCDWYTFEVTKEGTDLSLSMEREGCIEYQLYKKGQETPDYEGVIFGTHVTHWQTTLDAELAEGSYDLCVTFKDHGADAEYSTYNTRGGLYNITVKAHDQASAEQPSDDPQDSGQTSEELSDEEKAQIEAWNALEKAIDEAVKIEKGNYTDESYNALYDAVTAAYFLGLGQYVTTEELNAATARIEEAKKGLKEKGSESPAAYPTEDIHLAPTLPAVKISKPKAAKKAATIKWKKLTKKNLKKIKKIEIQYSTDKNFKKNVKSKYVSAKKTSYKIKSLKKGKKYYVRIRAYTKSGGKVRVSKWSARKSFKVK